MTTQPIIHIECTKPAGYVGKYLRKCDTAHSLTDAIREAAGLLGRQVTVIYRYRQAESGSHSPIWTLTHG